MLKSTANVEILEEVVEQADMRIARGDGRGCFLALLEKYVRPALPDAEAGAWRNWSRWVWILWNR